MLKLKFNIIYIYICFCLWRMCPNSSNCEYPAGHLSERVITWWQKSLLTQHTTNETERETNTHSFSGIRTCGLSDQVAANGIGSTIHTVLPTKGLL